MRWCQSTLGLGRESHTYIVPHWNGTENLSDYRQRGRRILRQFDEYCDAIEETVRAEELPVQTGRFKQRAYEWTIRAHILGDPISRVADEYGVHARTVSESVTGLLAFIDLPPRKRVRGRPEGSRDRHRAR